MTSEQGHVELHYNYRDHRGQAFQLRADTNPSTGECYLETYIVHEERGLQELHRSHPAPQTPAALIAAFNSKRRLLRSAYPHSNEEQ